MGAHQSLEYSRVLSNNVLSGQVHAPIFTAFPASLTVARGAAASFEATLNAAPATVAWMKDGKEVKEQPMKHRITASGNKVMWNNQLWAIVQVFEQRWWPLERWHFNDPLPFWSLSPCLLHLDNYLLSPNRTDRLTNLRCALTWWSAPPGTPGSTRWSSPTRRASPRPPSASTSSQTKPRRISRPFFLPHAWGQVTKREGPEQKRDFWPEISRCALGSTLVIYSN